jgi:hypothetical protein
VRLVLESCCPVASTGTSHRARLDGPVEEPADSRELARQRGVRVHAHLRPVVPLRGVVASGRFGFCAPAACFVPCSFMSFARPSFLARQLKVWHERLFFARVNGSESRFHPLGENQNPFKPLNIKAETAVKRFQLRRLGLCYLTQTDMRRTL